MSRNTANEEILCIEVPRKRCRSNVQNQVRSVSSSYCVTLFTPDIVVAKLIGVYPSGDKGHPKAGNSCTSITTGLAEAGSGPSNVTVVNSNIYMSGGENPSTDPRGLKHNWKPPARATVGIRAHGNATNSTAWLHHNRISGYSREFGIGDVTQGPVVSNIEIWKNQVTAIRGDCS